MKVSVSCYLPGAGHTKQWLIPKQEEDSKEEITIEVIDPQSCFYSPNDKGCHPGPNPESREKPHTVPTVFSLRHTEVTM